MNRWTLNEDGEDITVVVEEGEFDPPEWVITLWLGNEDAELTASSARALSAALLTAAETLESRGTGA